jgi:DNA helicase-2/ATP-dependent DNA helicase PcrA
MLNAQQLEAVTHVQGPALVVAGAGSGKTSVLSSRIVHLIKEGHAFPAEILALTFTNKAAREMRERVRKYLMDFAPEVADDVFLSTFHSAGVRWLRKYSYSVGLPPHFTIYDDQDQQSLVKTCLKQMGLSDEELTPKFILENLDRLKNEGISPRDHDFLEIRYPAHREKLIKIARLYEDKKQEAAALDFGDLLLKTHELLLKEPQIKEELQNAYAYILVDEYQDTNAIQYKILKMLSESHKNLFVVGDEDQSIYRWRGADIRNIREFEKDYPNAKIFKLEENYRSTQNILDIANAIISHNTQRREKTLFTKAGEGSLAELHSFASDYEEARWVARQCAKLIREGTSPSQIALLYRNHSISRLFEDSLRVENLPYIIYGGYKFYERAEIKDALAYMRLLSNPKDDIAFYRIINTPARGIGNQSIEKIKDFATRERLPALEALSILCSSESKEVSPALKKKFQKFLEIYAALQKELQDSKLSDFYAELLDKSTYRNFLAEQNTIEAISKLDNLEELRNVLVDFEEKFPEATLEQFLQDSSLSTDFDKANPELSVQMMTLHSAKGLEFPHVFILGLEEGVFPSKMSLSFMNEEDMNEERRLCYVGITRAEKQLYLTHAKMRRVYGQLQVQRASRFIAEMPKYKLNEKDHSSESPRRGWNLYDSSDERSYFSQSTQHTSNVDFDQNFDDEYKIGNLVEHQQYGTGIIKSRSGHGEETKVQVEFKGFGTKKFMTKFANLKVLESINL